MGPKNFINLGSNVSSGTTFGIDLVLGRIKILYIWNELDYFPTDIQ